MKIYIIGPSGSGKTTLGKKLASEMGVKSINLDYVLYKINTEGRLKVKRTVTKRQYQKGLNKALKKKRWVIEGRQWLEEVAQAADKIILLYSPPIVSLWRQWKRYFTVKKQRDEHGFINNLKLSKSIFRQYFYDYDEFNSQKYPTLKKMKRILKKYSNKLEVKCQ